MNKLFIFIVLIFNINLIGYSQPTYEWQNVNLGYLQNTKSVEFINPNTGFIGLYTHDVNSRVLRTTDKGLTFSQVFYYSLNPAGINVKFINENTGLIYTGKDLFRTTNGGNNWTDIYDFTNIGSSSNSFIFVNSTTGYLGYSKSHGIWLYKTTNGGFNWSETHVNNLLNQNYYYFTQINEISFLNEDINKIYLCGNYQEGQSFISFIIYSNDGFQTYPYMNTYYNAGRFSHISLLPNSNYTLRIFGKQGIYNPSLIFDMGTDNGYWLQTGLKFNDKFKGYAATYSGDIFKTTSSGNNWILEGNTGITDYGAGSQMNVFNEIVYFGSGNGNFFIRALKTDLSVISDNQLILGNISFDGENKSVSSQGTSYYLRGGYSNLYADNILNSGLSNERIFYKWHDNSLNNNISNYYFDSPGYITTYYKTKFKATTNDAISNESQTKCLRDVLSGNIHQIHQTMGGIFYSYKSSGGEFYTEEVVNGGSTYVSQFPNDKTAEGNKNPSICEIKRFGSGEPEGENEYVIAGCWERYDNSSEKTKLYAAIRQGQQSIKN